MSVEFLLTSLVVAAIPGTGVIYTVATSIDGGWRYGAFAVVGCTLGVLPHLLAAMLGLSGVMQAGSIAFEVVRWVGVAYLVVLGIGMLRSGGAVPEGADAEPQTNSMRTVVRRGILINLLNPKLTIFFFAFLPQFLDTPPALADPRLIVLGAVFMATTLTVFALYAYLAANLRERVLRAPSVRRWIERSLAGLLIAFAAKLAATDR